MRVDKLAQAFAVVHQALEDADVFWWLADGAALGAVREGRIIGGDIDIGVWVDHLDWVAEALPGPVTRNRCEVKATVDGVKVDVHGHIGGRGDRVWYSLGKSESVAYEFDGSLFRKFELHELYGRHVRVPCPAGAYLTARFGSDWRMSPLAA
jgi:hypothetical protein